MDLAVEDVKQAIKTHPDVEAFVKAFTEALAHYPSFLKEEPLEKMD